jgi:hypothetical protein
VSVKRLLEMVYHKGHMQLGVFCSSTAFIFWFVRNMLHFWRGGDFASHSAIAGLSLWSLRMHVDVC